MFLRTRKKFLLFSLSQNLSRLFHCSVFKVLFFSKIDNSYNISYNHIHCQYIWRKRKRRKRDLNPRAGCPTYTLSRGASSASWVFLLNIFLRSKTAHMILYASQRKHYYIYYISICQQHFYNFLFYFYFFWQITKTSYYLKKILLISEFIIEYYIIWYSSTAVS